MEKQLRRLDVGQHVRYCDQDRHWYNALVTAVHGEPQKANHHTTGDEVLSYPCVNLVFVVNNDEQQDQYGRQTMRETSVMHYGQYAASGFFWCHPEDEKEAFEYMAKAMHNIKS